MLKRFKRRTKVPRPLLFSEALRRAEIEFDRKHGIPRLGLFDAVRREGNE